MGLGVFGYGGIIGGLIGGCGGKEGGTKGGKGVRGKGIDLPQTLSQLAFEWCIRLCTIFLAASEHGAKPCPACLCMVHWLCLPRRSRPNPYCNYSDMVPSLTTPAFGWCIGYPFRSRDRALSSNSP